MTKMLITLSLRRGVDWPFCQRPRMLAADDDGHTHTQLDGNAHCANKKAGRVYKTPG